MSQYLRAYLPGCTWFFTVCAQQRGPDGPLVRNVDLLRSVMQKLRNDHEFTVEAIVILPDHLHCIWTLDENDADFTKRWTLIKTGFSRAIPLTNETVSASRAKRGERGIWQRRFWEHRIRDERDFQNHFDYIHWNPVKHGYTQRVVDWPYSSFHKYVRSGVYLADWASAPDVEVDAGEMNTGVAPGISAR